MSIRSSRKTKLTTAAAISSKNVRRNYTVSAETLVNKVNEVKWKGQ